MKVDLSKIFTRDIEADNAFFEKMTAVHNEYEAVFGERPTFDPLTQRGGWAYVEYLENKIKERKREEGLS